MEAVKAWARGMFILSVVSSTALLLIPKNSHKQAKFVLSMLLLLCMIAPLARLLPSIRDATLSTIGGEPESGFSLSGFLKEETIQRVKTAASHADLPVTEVAVEVDGFSLRSVSVQVDAEVSEETVLAFRNTLSAYLGISKERCEVTVR